MLQPIIVPVVLHYTNQQLQFTTFSLDKNVTTPSSYKVDAATGLPVMYLKDTKESLWHQYFELHPNGMKRTAFMTMLRE